MPPTRGRAASSRHLAGAALAAALLLAGCPTVVDDNSPDNPFPLDTHSLLPPEGDNLRVSVGPDPQPVDKQPIEFNHKIHASSVESGGLGMDCQFCHSGARRSIHAGVPPVQVCRNCHDFIDATGRPALEELKKYFESGETIPWVKVHDLPDFVHFDHSAHVNGGVRCQECHGPMEERTVAERDPEMTMLMGWCLECHATHPKVDENYGAQAELRRAQLKDCWTCHK